MRLVNKNTQRPLVEFVDEKTIFHNKFLEGEMRTMGIPIPHGLRGLFNGKDYVFLGDEHFQKAFKEVYYETAMDPNLFMWEI